MNILYGIVAQEQEIYEDSEADDGYGFEENDDDED